jgi:hypothetical protein
MLSAQIARWVLWAAAGVATVPRISGWAIVNHVGRKIDFRVFAVRLAHAA